MFLMLTACQQSAKELSAAELLDLGEKYLLEMNCEQVLAQFLKVAVKTPSQRVTRKPTCYGMSALTPEAMRCSAVNTARPHGDCPYWQSRTQRPSRVFCRSLKWGFNTPGGARRHSRFFASPPREDRQGSKLDDTAKV